MAAIKQWHDARAEHMRNDIIILAIFAIIAELLMTIIAPTIFLYHPTPVAVCLALCQALHFANLSSGPPPVSAAGSLPFPFTL